MPADVLTKKRKTIAPLPEPKFHLTAAPLTASPPMIGTPKAKRKSNHPSSVRSRQKAARDRKNWRDPLTEFRVWLPETVIAGIIIQMKAAHPTLRDVPRDDAKFKKAFAELVRRYIELALPKKPSKNR